MHGRCALGSESETHSNPGSRDRVYTRAPFAMLQSGWRPDDPLDAQREWWFRQKKDIYEKACILVLQAHVRIASKVQLYMQDKQK
ncbi:hypothetical protein chiPu_0031278 [Chiloscyllium punctatum]|uniref:Uncharacterized protein n=1 Tax=Chiloscyllium punctatum TaxID=137246 RepID=A0A401TWX7_CHIPU|nr:hypothetical protein [Chiloscyllium punctatum]